MNRKETGQFFWKRCFTDALLSIEDREQRGELEIAIVNYCALGEETDLEYPVCAVFEALRESMDGVL